MYSAEQTPLGRINNAPRNAAISVYLGNAIEWRSLFLLYMKDQDGAEISL